MEDNLTWPPCSNIIWKHLLNHTGVKEALNRPQKRPNMVLIGKFSQPYSQYPVRARASGGAVYPWYIFKYFHFIFDISLLKFQKTWGKIKFYDNSFQPPYFPFLLLYGCKGYSRQKKVRNETLRDILFVMVCYVTWHIVCVVVLHYLTYCLCGYVTLLDILFVMVCYVTWHHVCGVMLHYVTSCLWGYVMLRDILFVGLCDIMWHLVCDFTWCYVTSCLWGYVTLCDILFVMLCYVTWHLVCEVMWLYVTYCL